MTVSELVTHVLVVDDDAAVLRILRVALQEDGFTVATASNGIEALGQLGEDGPDAVILDLEMPMMDGRTFFREMRTRGFRIPVLILSAYDPRRAQRELQAEACMNKPFDPDELVQRVRDLVGEPAST
jgi:two-component system response regulator MprA